MICNPYVTKTIEFNMSDLLKIVLVTSALASNNIPLFIMHTCTMCLHLNEICFDIPIPVHRRRL